MSHFEIDVFGVQKKVVQVVQIGGWGVGVVWAKLRRTAAFFWDVVPMTYHWPGETRVENTFGVIILNHTNHFLQRNIFFKMFDFYTTCLEKPNTLVYLHLGAFFHTCLNFNTYIREKAHMCEKSHTIIYLQMLGISTHVWEKPLTCFFPELSVPKSQLCL